MLLETKLLGAVCDSLPESRLDEQYRTLSTAEQFAVIGGSAVAVVLLGTLVGGVFAETPVLVALAIGLFTGLTGVLARRHE
jgi:hypothetical protein